MRDFNAAIAVTQEKSQPSVDFSLTLLSKGQLSHALGISPVTIWRWVNSGHLPKPLQLGPRRIAWRSSDIAAFLNAREG